MAKRKRGKGMGGVERRREERGGEDRKGRKNADSKVDSYSDTLTGFVLIKHSAKSEYKILAL